MKKILFATLMMSSFLISCSKDGDDDDSTTPAEVYINTASGSTWTYQEKDNTDPAAPVEEYSITSTNLDTVVNSKTYHVYTNSSGESSYNGKSGNDYSAFESLPAELGGSSIDNIYLKAGAAVNGSWVQEYTLSVGLPVPVTVKVTNRIIEKAGTRNVLGTNYTNVIHVKSDIALSGAAAAFVTITTDINHYYAPNYGNIETNAKIDYTVTGSATQTSNTSVKLKSSSLL